MKRFTSCAFKIIFSRTLIIILMLLVQIAVLLFGFFRMGNYMHLVLEGTGILGGLLIVYIINKDEPAEFKMTWIMIICLLPILGTLIYLFVTCNAGGIGLRKRYADCQRETRGLLTTAEETKEALENCPAAFRGFTHYMEKQEGYPTYHHSTAVYYPKGEDKFADLLKELQKAEKYIFMEYFIVERGVMWNAILEILKQKVKEGVEVRVMYDGMCSITQLPYRYPKELRKYGIKAKMFSPIVPFLSTTQNNRDHRKIVVIDGKVAFTGGVNLADEYINEKVRFGHWKDTAVKITGDAVKSFTVMFLQMWNVYPPTEENYEEYFQSSDRKQLPCHDGFLIPYGETPTDREETAKKVYEGIFQSATKYVHIMTPYFIVEREFFDHMRYAAQRGVEVSMILPHVPDKKIAYYIARTFYPDLLRAGIKVYEYTPGFVHAKVFVSDDICATCGTVNLDYRSFYHHFECGTYFYKSKVVSKMEEDFQRTLMQCREVTWDYYKEIPVIQKILGSVFKLLAPLM